MNALIATVIYVFGIWLLFKLDRDAEGKTSKSLMIPLLWVLINGSRPVSLWLEAGQTVDSRKVYLDGSPLDAFVFGCLLLAGFIVLLLRGRQVTKLLISNFPILLFFAYCLVSVLWADYPLVSLKRWVKSLGDLVMVLIIVTDTNPTAAIRRLLNRMTFVLVPLSILLIKYYPAKGRSYNPWTWTPMYAGVTMGKNMLGMTCLICGLGSLWCLLGVYQSPRGTVRKRRLLAHGVVIAMVIWTLLLADSMTSLSCFLLAAAVMIIVSRYNWTLRRPFVHVLVASVVLISAFALFMDTGGSVVKALGRDPTLTGRTQIWAAVLPLVQRPLIGTGFESFWMGGRLEKIWEAINETGIQEAHNGYVEVYLNLGWIGVFLLAMVIISGYRKVSSAFLRAPQIAGLVLAYFVVGVVYNFTEAGFRMMSVVWFFFLFAVMAVPKLQPQDFRAVSPNFLTEQDPYQLE